MGLKADIKQAFLDNLDNSSKDENYEVSSAGDAKIDKLADDISKDPVILASPINGNGSVEFNA